jgi:hypothetical protein
VTDKTFKAEASGRIPDWTHRPGEPPMTLHVAGKRGGAMIEVAIQRWDEPDWLTEAKVAVDLDELAVMVRAIREVRSGS